MNQESGKVSLTSRPDRNTRRTFLPSLSWHNGGQPDGRILTDQKITQCLNLYVELTLTEKLAFDCFQVTHYKDRC